MCVSKNRRGGGSSNKKKGACPSFFASLFFLSFARGAPSPPPTRASVHHTAGTDPRTMHAPLVDVVDPVDRSAATTPGPTFCRICLDGGHADLVSPCQCRGEKDRRSMWEVFGGERRGALAAVGPADDASSFT